MWSQDYNGAGTAKLYMRDEAGNSGAVAMLEPKVNLLTNSGFWVWSNGTLVEVTSGAAPVTDGANAALVNNLLTNGGFDSNTTSWTGTAAALSSDAGGKTGNMLTVTNSGAAIGSASQSITTVVGKIYQFSGWFKKGTATGGRIKIGTALDGTQYYDSGTITDAGFAQYTKVFEATTTTTYVTLDSEEAATNTALYDSVTLYEVTPGCVGADSLAMDGWQRFTAGGTQANIYREYNGTNTKYGSFYSLKVAPTGDSRYIAWPGIVGSSKAINTTHIEKFKGRKVTFGAWVKTSTANSAQLLIYDGDTYGSVFHTGSGNWEWLELSVDISQIATHFFAAFNSNTADIYYISQPMLIFGNSIGSGNYAPNPNDTIYTDANIALTDYTATTSAADGIINLEAQSSGKLPKGAKAVLVKAYGKDSAAGDGVGFDVRSTSGVEDGITVDTSANNIRVQGQGWVKCDTNGDIYFDHRGSGASALTVDIKVIGVQY